MSIYKEAADLINEKGWGQRSYVSLETGCYCVMGAVFEKVYGLDRLGMVKIADSVPPEYDDIALTEAFVEFDHDPSEGIVGWNDNPERTKEEVIALLLRADEIAEARKASA